jgi:hypothetical protein
MDSEALVKVAAAGVAVLEIVGLEARAVPVAKVTKTQRRKRAADCLPTEGNFIVLSIACPFCLLESPGAGSNREILSYPAEIWQRFPTHRWDTCTFIELRCSH